MKNEKYLFVLVLLIVGGVAVFSWWNTETENPVTAETPTMNAESVTEQLATPASETLAVNGMSSKRDISRATAKEVPE